MEQPVMEQMEQCKNRLLYLLWTRTVQQGLIFVSLSL